MRKRETDASEEVEFSTDDASCESSSKSRANRVEKTVVVSLPCTHQLIGYSERAELGVLGEHHFQGVPTVTRYRKWLVQGLQLGQ